MCTARWLGALFSLPFARHALPPPNLPAAQARGRAARAVGVGVQRSAQGCGARPVGHRGGPHRLLPAGAAPSTALPCLSSSRARRLPCVGLHFAPLQPRALTNPLIKPSCATTPALQPQAGDALPTARKDLPFKGVLFVTYSMLVSGLHAGGGGGKRGKDKEAQTQAQGKDKKLERLE